MTIDIFEKINEYSSSKHKYNLFFIYPIAALQFVIIFFEPNMVNKIALFGMFVFLTISSMQDFYEKGVYDLFLAPVAIFSLFYQQKNNFFGVLPKDIDKLNNDVVFYFVVNFFTGSLIILFFIFLSIIISFIKNRDALGEGDFPILFSLGIVAGKNIHIALLVMAITALIYFIILKFLLKKDDDHIPLIPFINVGMTFILFFQGML